MANNSAFDEIVLAFSQQKIERTDPRHTSGKVRPLISGEGKQQDVFLG
jgi:hypothetical protein